MQTDKWTIEGTVKLDFLRVFCYAASALWVRNVMAFCKSALVIAKQGGTAGICILRPVLDKFRDRSFLWLRKIFIKVKIFQAVFWITHS